MSIRIGPFTNLFQMIERKYMSDNLLYQPKRGYVQLHKKHSATIDYCALCDILQLGQGKHSSFGKSWYFANLLSEKAKSAKAGGAKTSGLMLEKSDDSRSAEIGDFLFFDRKKFLKA